MQTKIKGRKMAQKKQGVYLRTKHCIGENRIRQTDAVVESWLTKKWGIGEKG